MAEWKKKCITAKKEFGAEEGVERWRWQLETYLPRITNELWWCGCRSFRESAYHICKHLIRLYIGPEGLESNKPPMPFYGEVWRQTVPPVLWVAGKHSPDQLFVRGLQDSTKLPILFDRSTYAEPGPPTPETEPPVYDSDDEEDEEDEENEDDPMAPPGTEDEDTQTANGKDDGSRDTIGRFWDGEMENSEELAEREFEGEQILDNVERLSRQLERVQDALTDAMKYPASHRHLREIPTATADNFQAILRWAERRAGLRKARVNPTTFASQRRGNMFM